VPRDRDAGANLRESKYGAHLRNQRAHEEAHGLLRGIFVTPMV
jgi:hypothetical protein